MLIKKYSKNDLNRCPFCGSEVELHKLFSELYEQVIYQVVCGKCGGRSGESFSQKEAESNWNKRWNESLYGDCENCISDECGECLRWDKRPDCFIRG